MKYFVSILLFIFITFLSTPTIIMLIKEKVDISIVYDFSEEENQKDNKEVKELKSEFTFKNHFELISFKPSVSKIKTLENCSKHDNVSEEIFIPPPKLI